MIEPEIVVNGRKLTVAQAMTLRIALTSFLSDMQREDSLGTDAHGRHMRAGYLDCGQQVLKLMVK